MRVLALSSLLCTLCITCFAGCHWRLSPPPGPPAHSSVDGTLILSGPLPVYSTYDGENPLNTQVRVGLFRSGTSIPETYVWPGLIGSTFNDLNMRGTLSFYLDFIEEAVPLGEYDLVLFAPAPGNTVEDGFEAFTPVILSRTRQITLTTDDQHETGIALTANCSGPGPYGSVSGRLLLSGNPLYIQSAGVVLKPQHPASGVDPATGLLWAIDTAQPQKGQLLFTVPELNVDTYEVSYYGNSLHDRDDPLAAGSRSVTLDSSAPDATGLVFAVTNAWQAERPYELGSISGSFGMYEPQSGVAYCIEARRTDLEEDDPGWYTNPYLCARWVVTAEDFEPQEPGSNFYTTDFKLAWLGDGSYEVKAYYIQPEAAHEPWFLGQKLEPVALSAGQRVIEGCDFSEKIDVLSSTP